MRRSGPTKTATGSATTRTASPWIPRCTRAPTRQSATGVDNDCDAATADAPDADADGVSVCEGDCDDGNPDVYPGAAEVRFDEVDNDCDPYTSDDCTYVPDPSLALGEPSVLVGTTEAHNLWRVRVGVPELAWSEDIAANAQAYADTCPRGHSSQASRQDVGDFAQLGENLYWHSSASSDPVLGVPAWASERKDFDFGDVIERDTEPPVGHYTAMVWDHTTHVGCGVARGCSPWGTTLVCQYGEAGNYLGQTPYGYTVGDCLDLDNDDVFQPNDPDDTDRTVP